jgi:hypothetical protein
LVEWWHIIQNCSLGLNHIKKNDQNQRKYRIYQVESQSQAGKNAGEQAHQKEYNQSKDAPSDNGFIFSNISGAYKQNYSDPYYEHGKDFVIVNEKWLVKPEVLHFEQFENAFCGNQSPYASDEKTKGDDPKNCGFCLWGHFSNLLIGLSILIHP